MTQKTGRSNAEIACRMVWSVFQRVDLGSGSAEEPIDFRTDAADDVGELRRANLVRTTRCPRQLLKSTMLCEVSGRWSEFPAGESAMCLRRPG